MQCVLGELIKMESFELMIQSLYQKSQLKCSSVVKIIGCSSEDLDWIPNTYMQLTTIGNSNSKTMDAFSDPE